MGNVTWERMRGWSAAGLAASVVVALASAGCGHAVRDSRGNPGGGTAGAATSGGAAGSGDATVLGGSEAGGAPSGGGGAAGSSDGATAGVSGTSGTGGLGSLGGELASWPSCGTIHLATSGDSLFLIGREPDIVERIPLDGGPVTQVAAMQRGVRQLTADLSAVYWTTEGDGSPGNGRIVKQPLPLTPEGPFEAAVLLGRLQPASGLASVDAIAVRAGALYYSTGNELHARSTDAAVQDDAIIGATAGPARVEAIAADGAIVAWTANNFAARSVERDDLLPGSDGYVELASPEGSLLATSLATDGSYVYWANGAALMRGSRDRAESTEVFSLQSPINAFALARGRVALIADHDVLVGETVPNAPPPTLVATTKLRALSVLIAGSFVYWADDCTIRRAAF